MADRVAITTAIFDFDGTLASSLEGIFACMQETLAHYGFSQPTLDEVRRTVGLTLEESMHRLTQGRCRELQTSEMIAFYRALHTAKAAPLTRLFEGAHAVLAELRAQGFFTVLVSNKGRAGLHQLLDQFAMSNAFDLVLSAEDAAFRKPDPRLYTEHIAPLLPHPPNAQTVVVGDTETDILFAKNAGLISCWAAYGYGDPERCKSLSPNLVVATLADLPAVVCSFQTH
ncbi:MAG TPA: HAD hydrolase-like protein [Edaphobacter sp.]